MSSSAATVSHTKSVEQQPFSPRQRQKSTRRRFRFNLPQRIAALLLLGLLLECLWVNSHQTMTETDYRYARCGREMWERPSPIAGYFTSCGNIHDGVLAYRLAGLPLTLEFEGERLLDHLRRPENRLLLEGNDTTSSTWEMRHQLRGVLTLVHLPFIGAGLVLGAALWWVTRRLFGNWGGYTALALYCFSPMVIRACLWPNTELLAALGLFGGLYTAMGVAHALQGPRKKWRPRIVLLALLLGLLAASHLAGVALLVVGALVLMVYLAEGQRSLVMPVLLVSVSGAMVVLFACYGFRPDAFSYVFRSPAAQLGVSMEGLRQLFDLGHAGLVLALLAALVLWGTSKRTGYFGHTAPLLIALVLLLVTTATFSQPWLWALPFLVAFVGGVFADAYDGPRGRLFYWAAGAVVVLQVVLCLATIAGPGFAPGATLLNVPGQ